MSTTKKSQGEKTSSTPAPPSLSPKQVLLSPSAQRASTTAEIQDWYKDLISSQRNNCIYPAACVLPLIESATQTAGGLIARTVKKIDKHWTLALAAHTESSGTVRQLTKLFKRVLKQFIITETGNWQETQLENILRNGTFLRSLVACCFETYFFVHNITSVSFEDLLGLTGINAFDFWKQINKFAKFQENPPAAFLHHLKQVENKILNSLAWKAESPLYEIVHEARAELTHSSYDFFFRRLIAFVAQRLSNICKRIGLNKRLQEEMWGAAKHFLSEYTEHLLDHEVDTVIVCTVYAVCKLNCEIPMHNVFSKYQEAFAYSPVLTHLKEFERVSIFYNSKYIRLMKDYLFGNCPHSSPRIATLSPPGSLQNNLALTLSSPTLVYSPSLMTPRTRQLWSHDDKDPLQLETSAVGRQISFTEEGPQKKFKGLGEVFKEKSL